MAESIPGGARERFVETNGLRMRILEQGCGFPVVLCHGFPEIADSWRRQLPALAAAGFRAIAPDQRGFGGTSRPEPVEAYDIEHLTGDLAGLLDALDLERAVFVGHDWGGIVAWQMPFLHPERTAGVIGVNTPAMRRPPVPPTEAFKRIFGENHYIVHFQKPGEADAGLARDVRRTMTNFLRSPVSREEMARHAFRPDGSIRNMVDLIESDDPPGKPLLSPEDLEVYVAAWTRSGFTGGINWYRNFDRNWHLTAAFDGRTIDVPSLMITAELDPVLSPPLAEPMRGFVPDLEMHCIAGCGHWTTHEAPDELNRLMVDWLSRRFG